MEGNKNAMYAQAGRNRGWNQRLSDDAAIRIPMPVGTPAMPPMAAPPMPAPFMPAPPVVVAPELNRTGNDCQTIAMAYVGNQKWQELYEPEQGFHRGTIFAELDLPFVGEGACKYE